MRELMAITSDLQRELCRFNLSMKTTVEHAVRIGEILIEAKGRFEHGAFMPWCEDNGVEKDNAVRYMRLSEYADKIRNVRNLQEAYKLIESEEARKKNHEEADSIARIKKYRQSGVKPEGWTRADDYRAKKMESNREFSERVETIFTEKQEQSHAKKTASDNLDEEVERVLEEGHRYIEEKDRLFNKMRITGNNANEPIFDALAEYLSLKSESERIEACHNIIKFCKGIVSDLQQRSIHVKESVHG